MPDGFPHGEAVFRAVRLAAALAVGLVLHGCGPNPRLLPATVDEDPSLPAVELNGSRFYLVRKGAETGTPIVFLAGGPGNDFLYLTRLGEPCGDVSLGAAHPLYFWDQRGCGLSKREAPARITLDVFRDDLDALIEHIDPGARGVILVGHSWGGMYASDYVNRHPERVRALVLLDPGALTDEIRATLPSSGTDLSAEWVNDLTWSSDVLTSDDHETLDLTFLLLFRDDPSDDQEVPPILRPGGVVFRQGDVFFPHGYDFSQNLAHYDTEVLFVAGDQPAGAPHLAVQERQVKLFPHATLEVVHGAGHRDVAWADACTTVPLIDAYLTRVGQ